MIVPTEQEGLTIFPTHRLAQSVDGVEGSRSSPPGDVLPGPVLYRDGRYELLHGDGLDPEVVAASRPKASRTRRTATRRSRRSTAAMRRRRSSCARRAIEDVWEVARRGDVMPQKSTFFYPKLTSGLLMLAA